ncbi:MAG: methionyl-tRNA formyltransferase [Oscillospiraceae bacterium]|nr:methionyl-tRNA formyltransferase [Oscillospiraceae bacterium]
MRIVFMGTPDFALKSLRALCDSGHDIAGVFTQPDKPKGRGRRVAPGPVKQFAAERGLPVFQPATLRDGRAFETLSEIEPELIAAVAYGKLLPPDILSLPPRGCVNIHGSLLPKYRGAAPVQRAIMGGERTTGVTSMFMAPELDAGDVILSAQTEIADGETFGELYDRLGDMGAELLCETVGLIAAGKARGAPQDHSLASFAPPISKDDEMIEWSAPRDAIIRKIRALNPSPAAAAVLGDVRFKIFEARPAHNGARGGAPGEAVAADGGVEVMCGDGPIVITQLQAPGGARMSARDYLRGHPLPSSGSRAGARP